MSDSPAPASPAPTATRNNSGDSSSADSATSLVSADATGTSGAASEADESASDAPAPPRETGLWRERSGELPRCPECSGTMWPVEHPTEVAFACIEPTCVNGPAPLPRYAASPAQEATPPREGGCWAYDCETAAAIDAVLIEKGIREHPDEGAYSADEWARSVVRAITEAAAPTPEATAPRCVPACYTVHFCGNAGAGPEATGAPEPPLTMLDVRTFASLYRGYHSGDGTTHDTLNESWRAIEAKLATHRATVAALTAERGARAQGQQHEG